MNWKNIREQLFAQNSRKKLILPGLIIVLAIVLVDLYFNSSKNGQLQIQLSNGKNVQLPYPIPDYFTPSKLKEPKLSKMTYEDQPLVQQFSQNIKSKQDKMQFSVNLLIQTIQSKRKFNFQVEYYRLNSLYKLDTKVKQKRICVITPFRNLMRYGSNQSFHSFLNSINIQNYSNYHVYMINDVSTDKTATMIMEKLKQYPRLNNRITFITNKAPMGVLGNRDSTIRNHCQLGSIVMDIDAGDALIGMQVFNMFNRFYTNNMKAWFIYSNFVNFLEGEKNANGALDKSKVQIGTSDNIQQQVILKNSYRTQVNMWVTDHLRTYLRDLYVKIPLSYVIDFETDKYYEEASDKFTTYSLIQLAGPDHTNYYEEFVYFDFRFSKQALSPISCQSDFIFWNEALARIMTPLKNLQSLSSKTQTTKYYILPYSAAEYFAQKKQKYDQCLSKQNKIEDLHQQ